MRKVGFYLESLIVCRLQVLPIPILIVDGCADGATGDDCLSTTQQILGFFLPAIVQGVIGNVVEPTMFGKSLNLTAISVLAALGESSHLAPPAFASPAFPKSTFKNVVQHQKKTRNNC